MNLKRRWNILHTSLAVSPKVASTRSSFLSSLCAFFDGHGSEFHRVCPPSPFSAVSIVADDVYRKPISLISHSDVRYRGILAGIDPAASTIQLSNGTP